MIKQTKLRYFFIISTLMTMFIASVPMSASARVQASLAPNSQFYLPKPNDGA